MLGRRPLQIGVMGSSAVICSKKAFRLAEEVGKEIARHGHILITGGGGGVMAAASRGADLENGIVVGILPGEFKREANRYVDIAIATGIGFARNLININSSHGIIIVEGGVGTLTEAAYAYTAYVPAVALVGSGGTADVLAGKTMDMRGLETIEPAYTPKEAVQKIIKLIHKNKMRLYRGSRRSD